MTNVKLWKALVAILLAVNIGTLAFMWMHQPGAGGPPGPGGFLIKSIGFDVAQQTQFARLRDAHQQASRDFRERNGALRSRFYDLLAMNQVDSTRVQQLVDSIGEGQKQMEMVTFQHFREVRALCRPEQQPKFDAVIGEALQTMQPPPPRR